jgi:hypothetical protein
MGLKMAFLKIFDLILESFYFASDFSIVKPPIIEGIGIVDHRVNQFLICSIFRLWGGIAHRTPLLWTTVCFKLPLREGNSFPSSA